MSAFKVVSAAATSFCSFSGTLNLVSVATRCFTEMFQSSSVIPSPLGSRLNCGTDVTARPAGRRAKLIDHKLTNPCLAVIAQPREEPANLRVGRKPHDEIIGHRLQRVVSA